MTELLDVDPTAVKRLANGFCHAKILLSAAEINVFTDLDERGPAAPDEMADRIGVHRRGMRDLLHALVALDLLVVDDEGRFDLSPVSRATLLPGSPRPIGGFLRRADHMLYPAWGNLTQALRTGRPQTPGAGPDAFAAMLADPAQRGPYLTMMDSANGLVGGLLADAVDWSRVPTVTDVGGCRGNLIATLVRHHPHLRATVFDLPVLESAFEEHVRALGVEDSTTFVAGDFFVDDLPAGDVVVLGHVLHNWSPQERAQLVRSAFDAVRPGGMLLVYDAMLPDDGVDLARAVVSLNMLLVTEGGSEYTPTEARGWFADAGCTDVDVIALGPTDTLLIGRKSAE